MCCGRRCRSERDLKERLLDILAAIAAIERYRDRDRAVFERDELLQKWFLRHPQIIGEAARALPENVRALAPEIPWSNKPHYQVSRYHRDRSSP